MGTRRHRLIHAAREHHAQKARETAWKAHLDKLGADLNGDDEQARQAAVEQIMTMAGRIGLTPPEAAQ